MAKVISFSLALVLAIAFSANVSEAKLVACIGDSITFGSGISDRVNNSYPAQLGRMLREFDPQWETRNFGVSGATLLRNGDRPYVQQSAYNQALAAQPDVVVIKLGTNDSKPHNWVYKDEYVTDYLYLIDRFAELPSAPEIWICKPAPAFNSNFSISGPVVENEILPFIDEIAQLRDVGVIDLHTALSDAAGMFPDGIHPNAEGAGLIAEAVLYTLIGIRALPDFDGDAMVDFTDFALLTESWLKSEPSLDIAPPPNGDGVVDYRDLIGLAQYWLRDIGLVSHWTLDETAYDSSGDNDGTLHGNPLFQTEGGMIDGALVFDGLDDYVSTPFVLDPSGRSFSVFAWIKGGAPGQVVIAQQATANWLAMDPSEGYLMTNLQFPGRFGAPLISQTIITQNEWHRIGFVRDGSLRTLYLDGNIIAEDTQESLGGSNDGLHIGTDKTARAGSFWSGLIDDVRIYNRVVLP